MDQSSSYQAAGAALGASLLVSMIIGIAIFAFMLLILWRICTRAGYSGAMSLLVLIPGVGSLILFCILAFGNWPVLEELKQLRMRGTPFPPPAAPYPPQQPRYPQYPS
jgi:hypothetical protein